MKYEKKDQFLVGNKITKDNQIFGTPNSKARDGTGNSPNDDIGQKKASDCNKFDKLELGYVPEL